MNIQLDTDWFASVYNWNWNWKGFHGADTINRLGYSWGEGEDLIEKDKKMAVLNCRLLTARTQICSVTIKLHYQGLKLSLFSVTDIQAW